MSLGQLLDSFQICVSYSPRHYYDPLATPPPPLPQGNVEKILANIDTYFACVSTQFNIVWGGGRNYCEVCCYSVYCPSTFSPHCRYDYYNKHNI